MGLLWDTQGFSFLPLTIYEVTKFVWSYLKYFLLYNGYWGGFMKTTMLPLFLQRGFRAHSYY